MEKLIIKISNKLYKKLNEIKNSLSYDEKFEVTINDMIEESLMSYYNIKLSDINVDVDADDNIINSMNSANSLKNYYVYIYYNNRNKKIIKVGDYTFFSEPIYVGKGQGNRIHDMNNRESNLIELINDLKSTNEFTSNILINDLDEVTAHNYEQLFINAFGRLNNGTGTLYNIREGSNKKLKKIDNISFELNIEYDLIKMIIKTLNETGSIKETSKKLNINYRTLFRKIKKYSIIKHDKNNWIIKNN